MPKSSLLLSSKIALMTVTDTTFAFCFHRFTLYIALLTILFLNLSVAFADDTEASINGGNIVFKKNNDIVMEFEDLHISQKKVSVEYRFKNLKESSPEIVLSFPLAKIWDIPYSIIVNDWLIGKDPINFHLLVNGQNHPFKIAVQKNQPIDAMSSFSVNYIWKQKFPAKQTVQISHQFNAVLGTGGITNEDIKKYCIDQKFLNSFEALKYRLRKKLSSSQLKEQGLESYMHFHSFGRFSFILKTANNWAGPIGSFRLKIDKGSPTTLVSTCWKGLRTISNTNLVLEKKNLKPKSDLDVLFVNEK